MDMEMESRAVYMQRLIRFIAEGNLHGLTSYARDIADQREVLWLAERSAGQGSGSSSDVRPNNSEPSRWLEAVGVLFESAADYAVTFESNMERARVRGLLHLEVQELYRIAAMRHDGNNEAMDAEVDRLMSRNQMAADFQEFMRIRAAGLTGAEATQVIWDAERAARLASGRLHPPSLPEQELTNC